jgi:WhiB family transcriptional regulator, redox-sensing transcriptional regulator
VTVPALRLVDTPTPGPDPDAGWQVHAACAGMNGDLFFPGQGESVKEAKAVCVTCPVINECLDYAMTGREKFGIWGGTTERERRSMRRRRTSHTPAVLETVRRLGTCSTADVTRELGISIESAGNSLGHLYKYGHVQRVGRKDRRWLYQICGAVPSD